MRVPFGNVGTLKIPDALSDEPVLFLSDILPSGYRVAVNAGVKPGSSVAIFGAGPVGMMAATAARLLGPERVFMVDHHRYRLAFAQQTWGVEPINVDEVEDAAATIVASTDQRGVDASTDAVGFEAKGSRVETVLTSSVLVLNALWSDRTMSRYRGRGS